MKSIFTDPGHEPQEQDLEKALGATYAVWSEVRDFTLSLAPAATLQWKYSGEKYGWGLRISDKKRVLVYLLPRDRFFRVGLVFGQKATAAVLASQVGQHIKDELSAAREYAEGRGIRLEVRGQAPFEDVQELIAIKISV